MHYVSVFTKSRIGEMNDQLTLSFDKQTTADAIGELQLALREVSPELDVQRVGEDGRKQDFGAWILLLLGTRFAVAIGKKIGDWIVKHKSTTLTIKRADGSAITLTNLSAKEAGALIELFISGRQAA
jgi:hypothetical protein